MAKMYPTRDMLKKLRKSGWKVGKVYAFDTKQAKPVFYSLRQAWNIYRKEQDEQGQKDQT